MTDNGSCYVSLAFRQACQRLRLPQTYIRTRPYTPRTNGKAERFIQTSLREWAYAQAYNEFQTNAQPNCPDGSHRYNWHRPPWQYRSQTSRPTVSIWPRTTELVPIL